MKQIILITDGCSNVGVSPIIAAAQAKAEGIVVNVIGLLNEHETDEHGADEIKEIALAGGGMSRIVTASRLSQTIQMMTHKTIAQTIKQVVGKELLHILGDAKLENLPPPERAQVVEVMDELSETAAIKIALLIDTSASMKPKLQAVKEAIYDLQLNLQARSGDSEMAVFHFPGTGIQHEEAEIDLDWTRDLANLNRLFYKLNMRGTTPTGPALLKVTRFIIGSADADINRSGNRSGEGSYVTGNAPSGKDGVLSDYIV